jgi:hypothetical protein
VTVGRHAAPGSDGPDPGDAPLAGGRRRTDAPGAERQAAGNGALSDHPTTPGRRRADRPQAYPDARYESGRVPRPDLRSPDAPPPPRKRPPVPPVAPRRAAAPRTTMAPFVVAAPEAQPDKYSPERLADTAPPASSSPLREQPPAPSRRTTEPPSARTPSPALPPGHPSAPLPGHPTGAAPARPAPAAERPAPAAQPPVHPAPQPAVAGAAAQPARPASAALAAGLRAPVLPGQPATHPSGPVYGDWTRPSRSGDAGDRVPGTGENRLAAPPATTAIPEREVSRGRQGATPVDELDDDGYDDDRYLEDDEPLPGRSRGHLSDGPGPLTDPGTGPSTQVRGGRAQDRAVRQAFDEKRRKELKRRGEDLSARDYLDGTDLDAPRSPRRKILALVAVAVVALGVLGVYSFVSPETTEASSGAAAPTSAAVAPGGVADATLPELSISAPSVVAPPADVKEPVIVLNATSVNGLAGRIAGTLNGAGWETPRTGSYTGQDVAVTTVFYDDGDQTQQQAAQALMAAFPQIQAGPQARFFDLPDPSVSGIVVVAAGDWQP